MMLGKLRVPGRPAYFDKSRAWAYFACSRCGWGMHGHIFTHHFSLSGRGPERNPVSKGR